VEDYYSLLTIRRDATQDEVKRAFRRLARELHPDLNPDPETGERFKEITQAYDVLSDTDKRRTYDESSDPFTGPPPHENYAPPPPPPTPPRSPRPPRSPTPPGASRPPRRRWRPSKVFSAVAASVILAIIVVVSLLIVSPETPASSAATPPTFIPAAPTSPAQASVTAQAAQINDLLNASAATTEPMVTALQDVSECHDISSAVRTIKAVAYRYRAEYSLAHRLNTGQLPNGAALKNDLINAFASSAWADLYFVEWAQQREAPGCAGLGAAAYNKGAGYAAKENTAKDAFVHLWNPVATSDGLPSRYAGDI
jgi:DnaJ domain